MKSLCVIVAACTLAVAGQGFADSQGAKREAPVETGLDEVCGIFVAPSGINVSNCGRTPDLPCSTISFAISRAQQEGVSCVFVQAGVYNEVVEVASGIHIQGGYNMRWQYDSYTLPGHAVRVVGGPHSGSSQYMTIRAVGLSTTTRISNLIIQGPNAPANSGLSSYAVYVSNSNRLSLNDVQVEAGNGGSGINGSSGNDAPIAAMNGGNGGQGASVTCDSSTRGAPGQPGINTCGGVNVQGGMGGAGGTADTSCPFNTTPTGGLPGQSGSGPAFGNGGSASGPCQHGVTGQPGGHGSNGMAGWAGGDGAVVGGYWASAFAGSGGTGSPGSGGGGGAGAGGCSNTGNSYGAGGGGGGAGGCPGTGGAGGRGGGSSFGVFAVSSIVQLLNVHVVRGMGGDGGAGGIGGRGQLGGIGGQGGSTGAGGGFGGNGGNGGNGGHGGGGGGGAGGNSVGIYCASSQINQLGLTYSGGAAGSGGRGGVSAPGGHPPMGNPGEDGSVGSLIDMVGCGNVIAVHVSVCSAQPCLGGGDCVGDLNGDGVVNVSDLLLLFANWGLCD